MLCRFFGHGLMMFDGRAQATRQHCLTHDDLRPIPLVPNLVTACFMLIANIDLY